MLGITALVITTVVVVALLLWSDTMPGEGRGVMLV